MHAWHCKLSHMFMTKSAIGPHRELITIIQLNRHGINIIKIFTFKVIDKVYFHHKLENPICSEQQSMQRCLGAEDA